MDMSGEYRIPAPRQRVWEALNDPEVLKAAIPGCEELNKVSENELEAKVKAKVGPVNAKFGGKVELSNLNPPESYTISGSGSGGSAGFAKGGADVRLAEDNGETILRYDAKAEVGGKLAQIGSRLVQGTAKKMADQFFSKFTEIVGDSAKVETAAKAAEAERVAAPAGAEGAEPERAAAPMSEPQPQREAKPEARRESKPEPARPSPTASTGEGPNWWLWGGGAVVVLIILILILS